MHKKIFILSVLSVFTFVIPFKVIAQEATTVNQVAPSGNITLQKVEIDKNVYASGDEVKGFVYIKNNGAVDQSDIFIDISLVGSIGTTTGRIGVPGVVFDTESVGPFTAKENNTEKIGFSYKIPKGMGGKDLGIFTSARLKSGLVLGWAGAPVKEVSGGVSLLKVESSPIYLDEKYFGNHDGPTVYPSSDLALILQVSNSTKDPVNATPVIEIRRMITNGDLVKTFNDQKVTVDSKGQNFMNLKIDSNLSPGVYVANVNLVDDAGISRIPLTEYRFIVAGMSATIHGVNFDAKTVVKGETFPVNVGYSGPSEDILTGVAPKIEGAKLNVKVLNGKNDEVVGETEMDINFDRNLTDIVVYPKISKDADTIKVLATIVKDSQVLAEYKSSETVSDLAQKNEKGRGPIPYFWLGLIALVLIVILLVIIALRSGDNNKRNIALSIVIFSTLVGGSLLESRKVGAQTLYYYYQAVGDSADYTALNLYLVHPQRVHLTKGETVSLIGGMIDSRCQNINTKITWTQYLGGVSSPTNLVTDATYGVYSHTFSFSNAIPSNQASGTYNFDLRAQVQYGYNSGYYTCSNGVAFSPYRGCVGGYQIWTTTFVARSYKDLRYSLPVYVYDPVSVTCTPDKVDAQVGEVVTWTMTPTGGTNSYTTYWRGTDGVDLSQDNIRTFTKTYTTAGLKTMETAIVDKATTNDSRTNGSNPTGWSQCGGGVNVSNGVITATSSSIRVAHYGSDLSVWPSPNLPSGTFSKLNSTTTSQNSGNLQDYASTTVGSHTVYVKDIAGYTETLGTCEYFRGGTECAVSGPDFSTTGITCDGTHCSVLTTTSAGKTRKIAVMYTNSTTCPTGQSGSPGSCLCDSNGLPPAVDGTCGGGTVTGTCPNGLNISVYPTCVCNAAIGEYQEIVGTSSTCSLCLAPKRLSGNTCSCPPGTSGPTCSANSIEIIRFKVIPDTVNKGSQCSLIIEAQGVESCTITNIAAPLVSDPTTKYLNGTVQSPSITETTRFTATCTSSADSSVKRSKSDTCFIGTDTIED